MSKKDIKKMEAKRKKEEKQREKEQKKKDKKGGQSRAMVIEGPTNVTHVSHIGWDSKNGFQIQNIPAEWRKLFQAAGVRKSELHNPETVAFLMNTVSAIQSQQEPPTMNRPPPGPPTMNRAPPGPPAMNRPPPSLAPPPPLPGGPPPPPNLGSVSLNFIAPPRTTL
jgi:Wiskott-Aldrich syndrome protein